MSEISAPQPEVQSSTRNSVLHTTFGASTLLAMGSVLTLLAAENPQKDLEEELQRHKEMQQKIPALVEHVLHGNREQMGQVLRIVTRGRNGSTWDEMLLRIDVVSRLSQKGLLPLGDRLLQHMFDDDPRFRD